MDITVEAVKVDPRETDRWPFSLVQVAVVDITRTSGMIVEPTGRTFFAFLQHPQQLHPQREWHVADLVQQDQFPRRPPGTGL